MTYSERSTQLALDASVAVFVLRGTASGDFELLPLRPTTADENTLSELKARWPGRDLRPVGVMGLVGTSPIAALKEPLETDQHSALVSLFLAHVHTVFCDSFAAQNEAAEIAELERLYSLPDMRPN